jgi:hypothetical protein
MSRRLFPLLAVVAAGITNPETSTGQQFTVTLDLRGNRIEGGPVAWSNRNVMLLGRDGFLWQFAPSEATNFAQTSSIFRAYSQGEMRGALMREFGKKYQVSGTGNYLVVHPAGTRDKWAPRFESLYRSFMTYFGARGIYPQRPQFPLVAVVFASRGEFEAYGRRVGTNVSGWAGFYSGRSNRILLYDIAPGDDSDETWQMNASVIIHEVTHQTAYNTGIHNRYAAPPTWVAEGLASMFEAPGVHSPRQYPRLSDRVNRERLEGFQRAGLSRLKRDGLVEMISSDQMFRSDMDAAYALAWILSFYLSENEATRYARYLKTTASREPFTIETAEQRLAVFAAEFGRDMRMLESRLTRFVNGLK